MLNSARVTVVCPESASHRRQPTRWVFVAERHVVGASRRLEVRCTTRKFVDLLARPSRHTRGTLAYDVVGMMLQFVRPTGSSRSAQSVGASVVRSITQDCSEDRSRRGSSAAMPCARSVSQASAIRRSQTGGCPASRHDCEPVPLDGLPQHQPNGCPEDHGGAEGVFGGSSGRSARERMRPARRPGAVRSP